MAGEIENLGRWAGHSPGRKAGGKNRVNIVMDQIFDTLGQLNARDGGELDNWLYEMSKTHPALYVKLLDKMLPAKTENDTNLNAQIAPISVDDMTADDYQARSNKIIARKRKLEALAAASAAPAIEGETQEQGETDDDR